MEPLDRGLGVHNAKFIDPMGGLSLDLMKSCPKKGPSKKATYREIADKRDSTLG